ncbi:30S ribosomal protein S7 [bacterium]|nr:30S ribosomal protein S7 [bacterium]
MARKKDIVKRVISPDPRYGDRQVAKFVNGLMLDGKKSVALGVFYGAMDLISERVEEEPLAVFKSALENVKPLVEVKSRRVGGATYQVPIEVLPDRKMALAIRWLINYTRARGEKSMSQKLAAELLDAASKRGNAIKKREDTHKMAEANKAFAHYRW